MDIVLRRYRQIRWCLHPRSRPHHHRLDAGAGSFLSRWNSCNKLTKHGWLTLMTNEDWCLFTLYIRDDVGSWCIGGHFFVDGKDSAIVAASLKLFDVSLQPGARAISARPECCQSKRHQSSLSWSGGWRDVQLCYSLYRACHAHLDVNDLPGALSHIFHEHFYGAHKLLTAQTWLDFQDVFADGGATAS